MARVAWEQPDGPPLVHIGNLCRIKRTVAFYEGRNRQAFDSSGRRQMI